MHDQRHINVRRGALALAVALMTMLCAAPVRGEAPDHAAMTVETYALSPYFQGYSGQWQGTLFASDGRLYFFVTSYHPHQGAGFFRFDPQTRELESLAADITVLLGLDPAHDVPHGKVHSDLVEHDGWIYFATHSGIYTPEALERFSGGHLVGYEMATGAFRDFGVIHERFPNYAGLALDAARGKLLVTANAFAPSDLKRGEGTWLYEVDIASGEKKAVGMVAPGMAGGTYRILIDQAGNAWFTVLDLHGTLFCYRPQAGRIDTYHDALPPVHDFRTDALLAPDIQQRRHFYWAMPIPGSTGFLIKLNGTWVTSCPNLYIFDPVYRYNRPPHQAFEQLARIGPTEFAMAPNRHRLFYVQRAGGDRGQSTADQHLRSVRLDASGEMLDYGLIQDAQGRIAVGFHNLAARDDGLVAAVGVMTMAEDDIPMATWDAQSNTWKPHGGRGGRSMFLVIMQTEPDASEP